MLPGVLPRAKHCEPLVVSCWHGSVQQPLASVSAGDSLDKKHIVLALREGSVQLAWVQAWVTCFSVTAHSKCIRQLKAEHMSRWP